MSVTAHRSTQWQHTEVPESLVSLCNPTNNDHKRKLPTPLITFAVTHHENETLWKGINSQLETTTKYKGKNWTTLYDVTKTRGCTSINLYYSKTKQLSIASAFASRTNKHRQTEHFSDRQSGVLNIVHISLLLVVSCVKQPSKSLMVTSLNGLEVRVK